MKTYCFALDLHDNPDLIEEYKRYHRQENIWPEVLECIRAKGVVSQRIYLAGNRMVMILETTDDFDLDAKAAADRPAPKCESGKSSCGSFRSLFLMPAPAKNGCAWRRSSRSHNHGPNKKLPPFLHPPPSI